MPDPNNIKLSKVLSGGWFDAADKTNTTIFKYGLAFLKECEERKSASRLYFLLSHSEGKEKISLLTLAF